MIEHVISRLTYKADTAEHIDELNVCGFRTFLALITLAHQRQAAGRPEFTAGPKHPSKSSRGRPNGGRKAHPSFETAEPCIL